MLRKPLPDKKDVREHAQGHGGVFGALMFEEQVHECVALGQSHMKEQVALRACKLRIDEGAGLQTE